MTKPRNPISAYCNQPGADIRRAEEGESASYRIAVNYSTASGGGTRYLSVDASSFEEAVDKAHAKISVLRGVLKIDGGELFGHPVTRRM